MKEWVSYQLLTSKIKDLNFYLPEKDKATQVTLSALFQASLEVETSASKNLPTR